MRTENLAVMLTDMKGFTAATSRQSRAENARMLALQDMILLPVVRAFGGKRVKTIGDAYLVLFDALTAGLLCGMAIQDRLWDYRRRVPVDERIEVRIVLSRGECGWSAAVPCRRTSRRGRQSRGARRAGSRGRRDMVHGSGAARADRASSRRTSERARSRYRGGRAALSRVARRGASEPRPPYGNVALSSPGARHAGGPRGSPGRSADTAIRCTARHTVPPRPCAHLAAGCRGRADRRARRRRVFWWVTSATERFMNRGDFRCRPGIDR
jgi:hypothetical protein